MLKVDINYITAIFLGATGLATAIGAIVVNKRELKALKKWVCTRTPCDDRIQDEPPL